MYHRIKVTANQLLNNSKVQVAFILLTITVITLGSGAPFRFGG